ncbi:mariner transposase [Trichonephila clavipes]|nr:mariner transposase [Trichonephila clavipes]
MIAASASPDEYAMRIATQTESALICKRVLVPIHCLSNSGVPGTTENAFSDGQALKVHTLQGVANRPPPCSLLVTVKRDIGRPVACLVISAACFFWPKKYWVAEFKRGWPSCQDEHRSGRPNEVLTPEMAKIHKAVLDNRRLKMRNLADIVGTLKRAVHIAYYLKIWTCESCVQDGAAFAHTRAKNSVVKMFQLNV